VKQASVIASEAKQSSSWVDPGWIASAQEFLAMTREMFHVKHILRHFERSQLLLLFGIASSQKLLAMTGIPR
jgi:hypothetical protein